MNHRRTLFVTMGLLLFGAIAFALPVAAQSGDVERGAALYFDNCAVCHGPDGRGRVGANLARPFPSVQPEGYVRQVVSEGIQNTTMPPWDVQYGGPLSTQDITDIVAFVLSLGGPQTPTLPHPTPVPITPIPTRSGAVGDPTRGALVYAENCVMCHGEQGEGRIGAQLAQDFPAINPSAFIEEVVSRGIANSRMPAWLTTFGGPLTLQQVRDVTAYVESLPRISTALPTRSPSQTQRPTDGGGLTSGQLVGGLVALALIGLLIGGFIVSQSRPVKDE